VIFLEQGNRVAVSYADTVGSVHTKTEDTDVNEGNKC
jgi:hypothetical protein